MGYLLVEGFSLTQSSIDGAEDDESSLLTCLGHKKPLCLALKWLEHSNKKQANVQYGDMSWFLVSSIQILHVMGTIRNLQKSASKLIQRPCRLYPNSKHKYLGSEYVFTIQKL